MPQSRVILCVVYGLIALLALIATWGQNLAYFQTGGFDFVGALGAFILDTKITPAARSIAADIALFFLAAAVFMVIEARKHGVRFVWAYIVFGLLVAISVTFPLFLMAREVRLAAAEGALEMPLVDLVPLAAFGLLILGLTWFVSV